MYTKTVLYLGMSCRVPQNYYELLKILKTLSNLSKRLNFCDKMASEQGTFKTKIKCLLFLPYCICCRDGFTFYEFVLFRRIYFRKYVYIPK